MLTKEEHIEYWFESSMDDYPLITDLFNKQYYLWSLFITHLVVEKLFKALYVKNINDEVPKIHNLLSLAERTKILLNEKQLEILDNLNLFQISARYPDYKRKMHKICTEEYTQKLINESKELILWLKSQIKLI